jgi:hypothetical protein
METNPQKSINTCPKSSKPFPNLLWKKEEIDPLSLK